MPRLLTCIPLATRPAASSISTTLVTAKKCLSFIFIAALKIRNPTATAAAKGAGLRPALTVQKSLNGTDANGSCKGSRLKADLDGGLNAVPIGMDADKKKR